PGRDDHGPAGRTRSRPAARPGRGGTAPHPAAGGPSRPAAAGAGGRGGGGRGHRVHAVGGGGRTPPRRLTSPGPMPPLPRSWRPVVALPRPLQWSKNALVLAALVFARQMGSPEQVVRAVLMAAAFCLASSAVYVFNDVLDRESDRRHPRKRLRPIAAGLVHWRLGLLLAPVLAT